MQSDSKILVVGPTWIGDMVMAATLFKILKQRQPQPEIHVLAPEWSGALLQRMTEVDRVIVSPFQHGELKLWARYFMAKSLRQEHYDQAIILPNSFKSALIPYWAKIPVRTGWRGELRFGLINDMRILDKKKLPRMIQRFAALAVKKGAKLPEDLPWPSLSFAKKPCANVLALCPGAEYGPAKRWPAEYFAEVANHKLAQGWQVWLFGSRNDRPVAAEIQHLSANRCQDLTGKTSLKEAIDLLAETTVVITNDTGLMHIAAALDKPLIAIYGSSSPEFTPPLNKKAQIISLNLPCSPCFRRKCPFNHYNCLKNLTPKQIIAKL